MTFAPFETVADVEILFPLGGKTYVVPVPDFELGTKLTALVAGRDPEAEGKSPTWLYELVLGPAYGEMRADNVPSAFFVRAGQTALQHFLYGPEAAEQIWRAGLDPAVVQAAAAIAEVEAAEAQPESARAPQPAAKPRSRAKATAAK